MVVAAASHLAGIGATINVADAAAAFPRWGYWPRVRMIGWERLGSACRLPRDRQAASPKSGKPGRPRRPGEIRGHQAIRPIPRPQPSPNRRCGAG
ncbi:PE family protein [Mycobacterium marinum]|uniref:PE family protein n=1 Tax=Mycobacterium marinum TaxID=1781 RepID=UPI003561B48E